MEVTIVHKLLVRKSMYAIYTKISNEFTANNGNYYRTWNKLMLAILFWPLNHTVCQSPIDGNSGVKGSPTHNFTDPRCIPDAGREAPLGKTGGPALGA